MICLYEASSHNRERKAYMQKSWWIYGIIVVIWLAGFAAAILNPQQGLISLSSLEGQSQLLRSTAKADFFLLAEHFVTQDHLTYCSPASMVMVLNGLLVPAHETPERSLGSMV